MIDYEVDIFNAMHAVVSPLCAENMFVSSLNFSPSAFPAVALMEMDNQTLRNRQSSTPGENYVRVTYQMDVFAQSKKACREVFSAADDQMILLGFNRFSGTYVPDPNNTKVYRYTARYQAEIDRNGVIYRRR